MRDLKERTKTFAIDVLKFGRAMKRGIEEDTLRKQLVRSATSVGAHYRAAQRARSAPDFLNKMQVGLEEADESLYWLEVLVESGIADTPTAKKLCREANELTAIFASIVCKLKRRGYGKRRAGR